MAAAYSCNDVLIRQVCIAMTRDDFLKLCGLAGLGFACPSRAATKDDAPYEGPYYVVFNASGGWDTTYMMDPKGVNEMNRLYQEGDILGT